MSDISDTIDWSKPVRMTVEEYLAFDDQSRDKHEYDDGLVAPLSRANRGEPNLWYYRRMSGRQRETPEHQRCVANLRQVFAAAYGDRVVSHLAADAAARVGEDGQQRVVALVRASDADNEKILHQWRSDDDVAAIVIIQTAAPSVWLQWPEKPSWILRMHDEEDEVALPEASRPVPVRSFYLGVPFDDDSW